MRVVVTGASGNVGTALARRLRAGGHEVVGIARRPPAPGADDGPQEWVRADLSRECHDELVAAFRGADAVVHLVWGFQPTHRIDYLEEVGVGGTRRVLDAVAAAGVGQLLHQSSIGAYSPRLDDRPVTEDWPTGGIQASPYSRHKAAAERLLDDFEAGHGVVLTRTRPGIIGQRSASSAQLRYFLPTVVPARVLRHVPVLPLDRRVTLQVVHADDVADAMALMLEARAPGAFNLVTEPVLTHADIAAVLGARPVHVPFSVLRAAADLSWRAHLQPLDPGWVDLALGVPVLDATRARTELGWRPRRVAHDVLAEAVAGMADAAHGDAEVLRERTIADGLRRAVRQGTVSRRRMP
ncbi:NAD-dependent epimerase/dehydratase family protein [Nocardioides sp. dk4132]|uniref:NAD-dependent epimerase/dehydratase family protein n=1 Tax=unclassified Nocardioides TaxID=2615069 RepID=UPI001294DC31|nr:MULTISPECIES: NAD-dependent epimerase/dehydratase family protein [unclassified Nocardioides]MQW75322.1 NAD-dependent epimerase/dehydratase family protein [Nocardioides sp. dk4132]QGA07528.1 NAD-dependent epimerase/dehydratase family protein [Nocardioides sp. dk884]